MSWSHTTTHRVTLSFEDDSGVVRVLVRDEIAMIKGEQIHDKQVKVTALFRSGAVENWTAVPKQWEQLRDAVIGKNIES